MIDIANAFVKSGYQVSLITGRLVQRNTPLHNSVKLDKIIKYKRSNIILRLITWHVAIFQILFKIWFKYSKQHLFIVSNPPIAPLIPLICNNSYSLLIYDVYIEKPEEFPMLNSKSVIVKIWKKAHSKVLCEAEKIFTLTNGMKANIEKYSKGKICELVPLWTDNTFLKPIPASSNPFITENNLQNKFVVLYSGNIGVSSGVEHIVEVASIIKSDRIKFVIIGDGFRKDIIVKKIRDLGLENCLVLPWQETSVLPYSLASASLAVVTLSGKSSDNAIPSKLFNYMSVGAPVLCLAHPESDLGKLVRDEKIGKCFNPEMKKEIANYIIELFNNPEEVRKLGENSLYSSKNYTKENANRFLECLK